jgi:hypothetical protein
MAPPPCAEGLVAARGAASGHGLHTLGAGASARRPTPLNIWALFGVYSVRAQRKNPPPEASSVGPGRPRPSCGRQGPLSGSSAPRPGPGRLRWRKPVNPWKGKGRRKSRVRMQAPHPRSRRTNPRAAPPLSSNGTAPAPVPWDRPSSGRTGSPRAPVQRDPSSLRSTPRWVRCHLEQGIGEGCDAQPIRLLRRPVPSHLPKEFRHIQSPEDSRYGTLGPIESSWLPPVDVPCGGPAPQRFVLIRRRRRMKGREQVREIPSVPDSAGSQSPSVSAYSGSTSEPITRPAASSPMAGPCLNPCPEPPPAIQAFSSAGCRSTRRCPSGVFVT